jgi:hypothetical protein
LLKGVTQQFEKAINAYYKGSSFDFEDFKLSEKIEPNHNRVLDLEWPTKALRKEWSEGDQKNVENL